MSLGDMQGKTVLVTGASNGIGLATSRRLAGLGAEVVMVSRDLMRGASARDEVAAVALGPQSVFMAADLSSQEAIRRLADRLRERYTGSTFLSTTRVQPPTDGG